MPCMNDRKFRKFESLPKIKPQARVYIVHCTCAPAGTFKFLQTFSSVNLRRIDFLFLFSTLWNNYTTIQGLLLKHVNGQNNCWIVPCTAFLQRLHCLMSCIRQTFGQQLMTNHTSLAPFWRHMIRLMVTQSESEYFGLICILPKYEPRLNKTPLKCHQCVRPVRWD